MVTGGGSIDVAAGGDQIRGLKQELEAQVPPVAASLDGLTFTYVAPVTAPQAAGSYVAVDTAAGPRLGQIRAAAIEHVEGPEVGAAIGAFGEVRMRVRFDRLAGSGAMLETSPPFHDAPFAPATGDALSAWQDANRSNKATLRLGEAASAPGVAAELDASGFARHTFLCGQSGSGKSYAMGLVLEQLLLETTIPIVVLDPNSDATRLRELADGADPALAQRWGEIAPRIAVRGQGREGDERLRLRFFDLEPALQQAVVGLDPLRDRDEFDALRRVIEAERAGGSVAQLMEMLDHNRDPQLAALALRIRNLGVMEWAAWSRDTDDSGLLAELDRDDWRCLVVDLGSIAVPAERAMVAAAVLSKLWTRRAQRRPVLLVIDEAHNVCPPDPADELTAFATEQAVRIAGEGRKFGIYLLVASQRPLKVHENVLSQCDNLFLMRMNSAGDLARLGELFSFVPPGLLARATSFKLGESLVAGRVASHPMLARTGGRIASEGGSDVPADWARA
jgi:DNA helicase HerA-like ATPase